MGLNARRMAFAAAFAAAIGMTPACGTDAKPTRTTTPSSPSLPAASSGKPLTETQLKGAVIAAADVPGLQADSTLDSTGVQTRSVTAGSGGPSCTRFLNATAAHAGTYRSSAEVGRGFTATTEDGPATVTVTLVSHDSAADAQRVVDDTRTSAKGCAHLTAGDGGTIRMNLAPMSLPVMGDDSTVTHVGYTLGKHGACLTVGLLRVGAVSLNITVTAPDGYHDKVLQEVARASVRKLGITESPVAATGS